MDHLIELLGQQNWLPAVATVVTAAIGIWIFRVGNRWDKVTRDAIKTEMDIAKALKDVGDERWEAWVALSQSRSRYLFDPPMRKRDLTEQRAIVLWGFIAWAAMVAAMLTRDDKYLLVILAAIACGAVAIVQARREYGRTKTQKIQTGAQSVLTEDAGNQEEPKN